VQHRVPQARAPAVQDNLFVRVDAAPHHALAPEEAQAIVRVPAAAPPPTSEVIDKTRNVVAVGRRAREHVLDLAPELRRHPLVGIEIQEPWIVRMRERESILLVESGTSTLVELIVVP